MVSTPSLASSRAVTSPTPHSRRMGSGARNAASSPGGTTVMPCGLRKSLAILATSLLVATPSEADSRSSRSMRSCRVCASCAGRAVVRLGAGDIQEGFVDGDRLEQRRVLAEDRHHLARHLGVAAAMARDEDGLGAEAQRLGGGHGGVDAELARLVGRGSDHPAHLGPAAHDDRHADQRGIVQPLDRHEEGVEVDVEDGACDT